MKHRAWHCYINVYIQEVVRKPKGGKQGKKNIKEKEANWNNVPVVNQKMIQLLH